MKRTIKKMLQRRNIDCDYPEEYLHITWKELDSIIKENYKFKDKRNNETQKS